MALTAEQVQRFSYLFRGRENCYGQFGYKPDGEKDVKTRKANIPATAWLSHLAGEGPFLGVCPITQGNDAYFGAIDVDDDTINHAELAQRVKELDLPLVVCRSKSGGAHLYLFVKDAATARLVTVKLREFQGVLGLKNTDGRAIEIFPKQVRLKPDEDGSWINLPYYGADATNRYAINPAGEHLTFEQFLTVAEMFQLSALELESVKAKSDNPFEDGPPCLEALHKEGYPEGSRNNALLALCTYFKMAYPDDWQARVMAYNEAVLHKEHGEVKDTIRSSDRHDYQYKCEELPISLHCQKVACKKRKHGINAYGTRKRMVDFPTVENYRIVETNPRLFIISVGGKDLTFKSDELLNFGIVQARALEVHYVPLPPLKPHEWFEMVSSLGNPVIIEAPEDAGVQGQFRFLVRDFITRRNKDDTLDDLLRGNPVLKDGRVYFRSHDLLKHLQQQRFKHYSTSEIYIELRQMGCTDATFRLKGAHTRAWSLPAPNEQTDPFEQPAGLKGEF